MTKLSSWGSLSSVYDLNILFLSEMQRRADGLLARIGFPLHLVPDLRAADSPRLEAAARFPRTLFRLGRFATRRTAATEDQKRFDSWEILELTVLFGAWTLCRDEVYQAKLFFGMSSAEVHALRTLALPDLPRTEVQLSCAFVSTPWMWKQLLTEMDPEVRGQLALVALQPAVDPVRC